MKYFIFCFFILNLAYSTAYSDQNFDNCNLGLGYGCQKSLLTKAQLQIVEQSELKRNFDNCNLGLGYGCQKTLLTKEQIQIVEQSELKRNFDNCNLGLGYGCQKALLTKEQIQIVEQSELQRNFDNCNLGLGYDCQKALLTKEQEQIISQPEAYKKPDSYDLASYQHNLKPSITNINTDEIHNIIKQASTNTDLARPTNTPAISNTQNSTSQFSNINNSNQYADSPVKNINTTTITPNAIIPPSFNSYGASRYYDYSYRPSVGEHYVNGYMRDDGTWVDGHYKTNSDDSFWNNWSSYGNTNPHTGSIGSKLPKINTFSSGSSYVSGYFKKNGTYVSGHYRRK